MKEEYKKIIEAAQAGGQVLKHYFGQNLDVEQKTIPADVRTKADLESEQAILKVLKENFSDYKFAEIVHERLGLPFNYEFISDKGVSKVDESDYSIKNPSNFSSELGIKLRYIDSDYLSSQMSVIQENVQSGVVL